MFTAVAVLGGSLESSKRLSCQDPRHLKGIHIAERQLRGQITLPRHTVEQARWRIFLSTYLSIYRSICLFIYSSYNYNELTIKE